MAKNLQGKTWYISTSNFVAMHFYLFFIFWIKQGIGFILGLLWTLFFCNVWIKMHFVIPWTIYCYNLKVVEHCSNLWYFKVKIYELIILWSVYYIKMSSNRGDILSLLGFCNFFKMYKI